MVEEIKAGQRWNCKLGTCTIRVMAYSERYAMVRRKGGIPFVIFEKDLLVNYILQPEQSHKK